MDKLIDFEQFWLIWPKKVAKAQARKAWAKLKPDADVFALIVGNLETHANSGDWADIQFIPYPATYLNGQRWDDAVYLDETQVTRVTAPGSPPPWVDKSWRELVYAEDEKEVVGL